MTCAENNSLRRCCVRYRARARPLHDCTSLAHNACMHHFAMKKAGTELKYNTHLRADISTAVNEKPKARVHSREWQKVMNGDPVEINPSVGYGYKIMSVEEWSARWKRNDDFPECLGCGSKNTKEHHFTQTWCRGKKHWESELLCLDCYNFTWRAYRDPDFKTPEQYERERWETLMEAETIAPPAISAS